MQIKAIKDEKSYKESLKRIDELMESENEAELNELEILVILVENYEDNFYKIQAPDPISAIKFRMEQGNLKQKDLIEILGDKSVISKVLSGQRELTIKMIKNLHAKLQIPYESLLGKI